MNANTDRLHPLTKQQSDFAAEHYGQVFDYLAFRKLDADEYHDVVILSYLCAVQQYDECPGECECSFEELARDFMRAVIYQYHLTESQRNRVLALFSAA